MNTPDYNSMTPEQLAREAVPVLKQLYPGIKIDDEDIHATYNYLKMKIVNSMYDNFMERLNASVCMKPADVFAHAKRMIGEDK